MKSSLRRESIDMGEIDASLKELESVIDQLSAKYIGNTYSIINR